MLLRRRLVWGLLDLLFLPESLITSVDVRPRQLIGLIFHLVAFDQVFVTDLEHFVDEASDLWIVIAVADQDVGQVEAGLEQDRVVLLLHAVQFLDDFKNLVKAVIHELVALFLEVFITDEDLIV